MESFFSLLERRVQDCSSLLCVGLDPHPEDLPRPDADSARDHCLGLIRATARYAAAFKPNAAFFELYGPEGWRLLAELSAAVRAESDRLGSRIPIILDAKRGDIASTASAYAHSAFDLLHVDAITLSPYLGYDAIEPFLADREKGVFVLCRTSNPGAGEVQDLPVSRLDGAPLYLVVAQLAQRWNAANNVGLVVGANQPEALARVRAAAPGLWILAPGVGAQGGDLEQTLRAGLRPDGMGLLIPVSRGLSRADDPAQAAAQLRDQIVNLRRSLAIERENLGTGGARDTSVARLCDRLLQAGCVRFGTFTLKSGAVSPIYIDLRRLVSNPGLMADVADAYLSLLRRMRFDRLAAIPYAAIPITTAIAMRGGYAMLYPRKEAKAYGTQAEIEGDYRAGETVVVIDDLATTGASKFEAIKKLTAAGLQVTEIVVLIDRQAGAAQALEAAGLRLHAVLTLAEMLEQFEATGRVPAAQLAAARAFLRSQPG